MQKAICKPHGRKYNDGRNLGSLSTYGCILAPYLLPIFETGYLTISFPPLGKNGFPIPAPNNITREGDLHVPH